MSKTIDIKQITNVLKTSSLRVTKSRLAVAEVLIRNKFKYLTSEEIYQKILVKKNLNCDQVSVYRILAKFEEIGVVTKGEFHKDAARYIINQSLSDGDKHEHYFKCIQCYTVEPFSDCFISKKEKEMEANGYRNLSHHLEITGLCPNCA